jgi:hypothetical protein
MMQVLLLRTEVSLPTTEVTVPVYGATIVRDGISFFAKHPT